jgi:hypothetical protein
MYIMIMICQLYREKNLLQITEALLPLAYTMNTTDKRLTQWPLLRICLIRELSSLSSSVAKLRKLKTLNQVSLLHSTWLLICWASCVPELFLLR